MGLSVLRQRIDRVVIVSGGSERPAVVGFDAVGGAYHPLTNTTTSYQQR
jgi:hypothetical protein